MGMIVGLKVDLDPIPPILENTEMFKAGAISFGVEFRELNNDIVTANYGVGRAELMERGVMKSSPEFAGTDDSGVSIHVYGGDGREYLRFDCFAEDPHYHYILPDETFQRVVPFDAIANGDPLTWTMGCLRNRLEPMLREAGDGKSAERLDAAAVRSALDQVERAAKKITRG
jgi:hypothetical protein